MCSLLLDRPCSQALSKNRSREYIHILSVYLSIHLPIHDRPDTFSSNLIPQGSYSPRIHNLLLDRKIPGSYYPWYIYYLINPFLALCNLPSIFLTQLGFQYPVLGHPSPPPPPPALAPAHHSGPLWCPTPTADTILLSCSPLTLGLNCSWRKEGEEKEENMVTFSMWFLIPVGHRAMASWVRQRKLAREGVFGA